MLDGARQIDLSIVDSATTLLSKHIRRQEISLHHASLMSLVHGVGILFSCALVHSESHEVIEFPMRLIRACIDIDDYTRRRGVHRYISVILGAFALSRHDFPGWITHKDADHVSRAVQAVRMIAHYSSLPAKDEPEATSTLMYFGLLEILRCSETYRLGKDDLAAIAKTFSSLSSFPTSATHAISVLPSLDFTRRSMALLPSNKPNDQVSITSEQESLNHAHISAIRASRAWFMGHKLPTTRAYVFVVETLCCAQSSELKNACWDLIGRFPFPEVSESGEELMNSEHSRMLLHVREAGEKDKALFAIGQLWLIVTSILRSSRDPNPLRFPLIASFLRPEDLTGTRRQLEVMRELLAQEYIGITRTRVGFAHDYGDGQVYVYRVLECILQSHNCSPSDSRWKGVEGALGLVPNALRGTSSFTGLN